VGGRHQPPRGEGRGSLDRRRARADALAPLIQRPRDLDAPGAALALLVGLFWGGNIVAIKIGLLDAPPLRLAWLRFLVGGGVIALWAWATGRLAGFRIERHEWRPLLVLGALFTAQIGTMNVGTWLTNAAHASILLNLHAVHTVVLAHFLIPGDRLSVRRVAGILLAYAGILVLFTGGASDRTASLLGDIIMFVSAAILAERTVYLAGAVQRFDPVKLLLSQAVTGIAVFVALSQMFEPAPTRWTWRLAGALLYQGALVAGFCFVVNLWLLKRYRPSALATFSLTQPIFGVIAATLVAGDPLTAGLLVACAGVAAGIALTGR
jgi:drug/metabolite transporter (DMT)-like permease